MSPSTLTLVSAVAARTGTATWAQSALGIVQLIVTGDPVPRAVLDPMATRPTADVVVFVRRRVCAAPATVGAVLPTAPTTSKMPSPTAAVALTDGVVLVPMALPSVPSGVVWWTPVNDIDVAVTAVALGAVTTTL